VAGVSRQTFARVGWLAGFGASALGVAVACSGNELKLPPGIPAGVPGLSRVNAAPALVARAVVARPERAAAERAAAEPAAAELAVAELAPVAVPAAAEPARGVEPSESEPESQGVPPELVATAREVIVYAAPERTSGRLGYLRLGARVRRAPQAAGYGGCAQGWYRIAPEGFVCVGNAASLSPDHPLAELARTRPDREAALPYAYGRSKPVPPPLYTHLPSRGETIALEGTAPRSSSGFDDLVSHPVPESLAEGGALPTPFGFARPAASATPRALPNSGFALLDVLEHEGRRFGLTTDLELVPLDRLTRVLPSELHGIVLDDVTTLPLVFVRGHHGLLFAGSPERGFRPLRPLHYREALPLAGRSVRLDGVRYLEVRSGEWLKDQDLVRVDAPTRPPAGVRPGRTWIHVSINQQTLVAFVGSRPVYATLVSTGADGLGDPETTHSTPRGEFLIHTKHLSATMNGDEVGDEFDLRDVPYVQYFTQGFAFHAAYWHDAFGAPHSHGCVNLSPLDARWLFHFSEPGVPRGWHGAFSRAGTLVSITP